MGDLLRGGDDTDDDVMKIHSAMRSRVLKSLSPQEASCQRLFRARWRTGVTINKSAKYDLTKGTFAKIKGKSDQTSAKARYSSALKAYLG